MSTLGLETRSLPKTPDFYSWSFPGAPVRIQLSLEVVARLGAEVQEARRPPNPVEVGGVLLGRTDPNQPSTIQIWEFQAVVCLHRKGGAYELCPECRLKLERVIANASQQDSRLRVVGYYRSTLDDDLRLNDRDLSLVHKYFAEPSHVVLLIRPTEAGPPTAGFFFWDNGQLNADFTFLDFPFDAPQLAESPSRTARAEALVPSKPALITIDKASTQAAPVPTLPAASESAPARKFTAPWAVLAAALIFAAALLAYLMLSNRSQQPNEAAAAASSSQSALSLQVERAGTDLRVSWDQNAPILANARVGILSILDGETQREIHLDRVQLRTGRVVYAPATDRIHFRLEVYAPGGQASSETVLAVLGQRPGAAPAVPSPAPRVGSGQLTTPPGGQAKPPIPPAARAAVTQSPALASTASNDAESAEEPPAPSAAPSVPARAFTPPSTVKTFTPDRTIAVDAPPQSPALGGSNLALNSPMASSAPALQPPPPTAPKPAPPAAPKPVAASDIPAAAPLNSAAATEAPKPAVANPPVAAEAPKPPAAKPAAEAPKPAPARTDVGLQTGDYAPPRPVQQTVPSLSANVRALLTREYIVDVKVNLDSAGRVLRAEPVRTEQNVPGYLGTSAAAAARLWRFEPARRGAVPVPSEIVLQFRFSPPPRTR
jgi:hypothetical protein